MTGPGEKLAHYEITSAIGKGGMGEVLRAKDTKLGREVAIKVLPDEFTRDAERLSRFEREARILASLDHPNIASIYEIGSVALPVENDADDSTSGTVHYLAMQLAEGEDLADRLKRGPIPVDEALAIARQIADALEAAHDKGIVHRDLKPANIKLGSEGHVRVLDFGLAKALESEESDDDFSNSPTMVRAATQAGMILGTAAYMSPEQARGRMVDKRTDLWAFGVVLWEMLTGERLFGGETVSDTLAGVLKSDVDFEKLPRGTPGSIVRLLKRCLTRDRRHRLADAADARLEIEDASLEENEQVASGPAAPRTSPVRSAAIVVVALLAGAFVTWLTLRGSRDGRPEPVSLEITGAAFTTISSAAISPDGTTVAFVPYSSTSVGLLHIRELSDFSSRTLPGTESARNPFFSPDGRSVGFFNPTARGLFVVGLFGEAIQKIATVQGFDDTGTWLADGRIVSSGMEVDGKRWRGLAIVPSSGGTPTVLTTPGKHERYHAHPIEVPGGRWVLFTIVSGGFSIDAVSLEDGSRHRVVDGSSSPQYSPTGHLLFYRASDLSLLASRFDTRTATLEGETVVMRSDVLRLGGGKGAYALSGKGTLIYTASDTNSTMTGAYALVSVDRKGAVTSIFDRRDTWTQPRLSPDGRTLLVRQTSTPDCTLWTVDLTRGTLTRLTFRGDWHGPQWTTDGHGILSATATDKFRQVVMKGLDAESPERPITKTDADLNSPDMSPDGRVIVFSMSTAENGEDIYTANADGTGEPRPFATSPFDEVTPRFSPDGNWIAYTSDESGRPEVYIKPFRTDGPKFQVSVEGGEGPLWSRDGSELFFGSQERLMVVRVSESPELRVSAPEELFGGKFVWERPDNYDVTNDGQHFVMVQRTTDDSATEQLRVVLAWSSELETRLPP